jgi:hypothetical protein
MIARQEFGGTLDALPRRKMLNGMIEVNELGCILGPEISRPPSRELCLDIHALRPCYRPAVAALRPNWHEPITAGLLLPPPTHDAREATL